MPLALIIGASSGVGAAAAKELAGRGYRVVLTARSGEPLAKLASDIGDRASFIACDASSSDGIESLAKRVREKTGVPDVIVNCAGLGEWKRIEDTSPEEARLMIGAPYLAAFNASHIFMREMLARRSGVLIHVNSPACFMPWPSAIGYSAARFALRGLHEALCQDLAGTGVHSCHIVFGRIDSEYFDHNPGVVDKMPGISKTIRTISVAECARVIASVAQRPRRQVIYPTMLKMFYWSFLALPQLTRWLLRATAKESTKPKF